MTTEHTEKPKTSPLGRAIELENASIDKRLGHKIKQLRVQAGLTQADIAIVLDISPQQYQKYEKGATKCSLETIYRLAEYYNLNPFDLLPRPDDANTGFHEEAAQFSSLGAAPISDEATAVAELLAIFVRIPSKDTRRKVLDLLGDLV